MPLNQKQISIISEQLKEENASEFVETLVLQYASDVDRTSHLLSLIPKISEKQLQITQNKVTEYATATNLLIGTTDKNKNIDFPTLMYTCKAFFPNGNNSGHSPAGKLFFEKFIDAIKNKKGFDYEAEADWNWICNIADCEEWMLSVIKQNVEESD